MTEDSIRAELSSTRVEEVEEEDTELDDEAMEKTPVCSQMDAKKYLVELRRYFESCKVTKDSDFSAISQLDNALLKTVDKTKV